MKRAISLLLIAFVLLSFAGVAFAMEMSGEVTAVDYAQGTVTLTSGTVETGFVCEEGAILKDVKVGDKITVEYTEEGGKKKATKITPMAE